MTACRCVFFFFVLIFDVGCRMGVLFHCALYCTPLFVFRIVYALFPLYDVANL